MPVLIIQSLLMVDVFIGRFCDHQESHAMDLSLECDLWWLMGFAAAGIVAAKMFGYI